MNLILVDFDGTLANSELKPHNYRGDWWGKLESLSKMPEINASLLQEIEEHKQACCKIVILTGRTEIFVDRITEILEHHNVLKSYDYDELICQPLKTYASTKAYKREMLKALIRQYPEIERVIAYDDKDIFLEEYQAVCDKHGIELDYRHTKDAFPESMKRKTFSKNHKQDFFAFLKGVPAANEELGPKLKEVDFCDIELIQENSVISCTDEYGSFRVDLYVIDLIEDENTFSFYLNDHPMIASCGF